MKKHFKKALLVNAFGSLGYIFCLISWGWIGILYLPMLLENEQFVHLLLPAPSPDTVTPQPAAELSPVAVILAVGVTAVVLITTIVVLLRAPIAIAKTGKTVTSKAASSALPLITHGRPVSPDTKRRLTAELIKCMKLLLALIPVGAAFFGAAVELPLPLDLVVLVSSMLALFAVLWFSLQYILARALAVNIQSLV